LTDSVLIGRFLSYLFYEGYYTSFSSEIPILLSQKHKLLPFFQDDKRPKAIDIVKPGDTIEAAYIALSNKYHYDYTD